MSSKPRLGVAISAALFASCSQPVFAQSALEQAAGNNIQLQSLAQYIDNICPKMVALNNTSPLQGDQLDLLNRCRAAKSGAAGDPAGANLTLQKITPDELLAQDGMIRGAIQRSTAAVYSRLNSLSRFSTGADSLSMAAAGTRLAVAGSDRDMPYAAKLERPLQLYGSVGYSWGNQHTTTLEPGFDIDSGSGTIGLDYRFAPAVTAGLSFSYGETKLGFYSGNGSLKTHAASVAAYAVFQPGSRFDLSLLAAYSRVKYRSNRPIDYSSAFAAVNAAGNTSADQFEASAGGYYDLGSGPWKFGPAFQVSYSSLSINGFDETGAGGLNFSFPHQHMESLQFALGAEISRAFDSKAGIITPYARFRAIYEALDSSRTVTLRYVNDPVTVPQTYSMVLTTASPDRDRYTVGGGIAAQFAHNVSAYIDLSTMLGLRNVKHYAASAGLRIVL